MNISIDEPTERKLWGYIKAVKTEIGGFGYAKLDGDTLTWNDVFLVPQVVTGSEVDFDGSGLAYLVDKMSDDGVLGCEDFVPVSWHSHHTMKAFWSGTDEKCIKTYGTTGVSRLLSFVGCHDYDYKLRIDLFGVEHAGITVPQVTMDDLALDSEMDAALNESVKADIARFVRKPAAKPAKQKKETPKPWTFSQPKRTQLTDHEELVALVDDGISLEDAFEIKELMGAGVPAHEAYEMVCHDAEYGYVVGPAGLVKVGDGAMDFDSMAWGD